MNTEITDNKVGSQAGEVFFDGRCRLCVAGRRRWGRVFERRGYVWVPMQTPGTAARLGVSEERLMAEMWVLPAGGRPLSGVAAWHELLRHVWWLWPLALLIRLPACRHVTEPVYRWIAAHRHCLSGRCDATQQSRAPLRARDVALISLLIVGITALGWRSPAWVFMWTMGVALGMAGKCITLRDARESGHASTPARGLAWFFLWPGLDGRAFFRDRPLAARPGTSEWIAAGAKLTLGLALVWWLTPLTFADHPHTAGWLGMIGIVLGLHFGAFHLLSLAWRAAGVNADPIMNRPLGAKSLAGFWGERWNTAFSIPARRLLFNPLARRFGAGVASAAVFMASGVMHELVISLPARAGFGLPTAYFALQGAAVGFERSRFGRAAGLGSGARGWWFTVLIVAGPVYWLFHPPFVRNVILPMLEAFGATGVAT